LSNVSNIEPPGTSIAPASVVHRIPSPIVSHASKSTNHPCTQSVNLSTKNSSSTIDKAVVAKKDQKTTDLSARPTTVTKDITVTSQNVDICHDAVVFKTSVARVSSAGGIVVTTMADCDTVALGVASSHTSVPTGQADRLAAQSPVAPCKSEFMSNNSYNTHPNSRKNNSKYPKRSFECEIPRQDVLDEKTEICLNTEVNDKREKCLDSLSSPPADQNNSVQPCLANIIQPCLAAAVANQTSSGNGSSSTPAEVQFDENGKTWDVYGAGFDPEILGDAIQIHLESIMRTKKCTSMTSLGTTLSSSTGNDVIDESALFQDAKSVDDDDETRERLLSSLEGNDRKIKARSLSDDSSNQNASFLSRFLCAFSKRRSS